MNKALNVFGKKPEDIKILALIEVLRGRKNHFVMKVCISAQHQKMLNQVLDFFEIKPDYDFNEIQPKPKLSYLNNCRIIEIPI
ncbi:hypothetical protein [Psychroflexus aestuariivivens]|uniref:hypothetical protein n=1 Tax=Psychroflexus aestuariivivens TaxID=1795040 RepID=UPI000FD8A960|nr:hypothetical protein [Psychroflexus aestuariivivens]